MTLFKTTIFSFIATAIKMVAALIINKAVAIYIGPTGLALVGQFQSFTQMMIIVAQGALNTGTTKFTAEYGKEDERLPALFSTASLISLASSVIVGIGMAIFSNFFSLYFLGSEQYSYIILIFSFTIILFVINSLLLSILNGLKEIRTWISISIIQSIYGLIFTTLLIFLYGFDGALIALVTNQSIVLLIVLWMLRKHPVIRLENFKGKFDKKEAKKLMGYAITTVFTVATVPVSHLIIRNHIGDTLNWEQAGYWQAIWYISTMYLLVVTTTLNVYYLPKLSELVDKRKLRKELIQGYQLIIPIVTLMAMGVFLLKDILIQLLFSDEFTPMRDLFLWQLVGDVFKIAAFIPAYYILVKEKLIQYIFIQTFASIMFVTLAYLLINKLGLSGVVVSYSITYFVCFLYCFLIVRSEVNS